MLLPADGAEVVRCWNSGVGDELHALRDAMLDDLPEVVVIQFNYGFLSLPALAELILTLKRRKVTLVVVLHSTLIPPDLPERRLGILSDALACVIACLCTVRRI